MASFASYPRNLEVYGLYLLIVGQQVFIFFDLDVGKYLTPRHPLVRLLQVMRNCGETYFSLWEVWFVMGTSGPREPRLYIIFITSRCCVEVAFTIGRETTIPSGRTRRRCGHQWKRGALLCIINVYSENYRKLKLYCFAPQ